MVQTTVISLRFLFSNSITELCVPLCLPEIKMLDVSKNSVENISPDFLTGCLKLETLNVSMNKICECCTVNWLFDSKSAPPCNQEQTDRKDFTIFNQSRFSSQSQNQTVGVAVKTLRLASVNLIKVWISIILDYSVLIFRNGFFFCLQNVNVPLAMNTLFYIQDP